MTRPQRSPAQQARIRQRLRVKFAALVRVLDERPLVHPLAPMRARPRQLMGWHRANIISDRADEFDPREDNTSEGGHVAPLVITTRED